MRAMRGSIKARGDAWRLVVELAPHPVTGKRRQLVRNVRGTREDAERRLAQMIVEAGGGATHDGDATIAVLLDAWLTQHRGLSPSTRLDYRRVIAKHLPAPFTATKVWRVRTHDLDRRAVALLRAHQRECAERALAVGARLGPDAYVFAADAVGIVPRRPDAMTHEFATVRTAAGVTGVRLHDLRHFMITQLLAAGTDVRTVAGRAGHRRTSTTLDLYSAFLPASDRDAAERMGELLG